MLRSMLWSNCIAARRDLIDGHVQVRCSSAYTEASSVFARQEVLQDEDNQSMIRKMETDFHKRSCSKQRDEMIIQFNLTGFVI